MKSATPLHTDHQLDQLAGQFEHWRQTRSPPAERIPTRLLKQAAALARVLPYSRVAQHVRVSPSDLKKHMATPHDAKPATPPRFVEVPLPASHQIEELKKKPTCLPSRESQRPGTTSATIHPRLPAIRHPRTHR